jgi:putative flippase GtrA
MLSKKGLFQFGKFAIVGFIGTLVHLTVLFILTEFFGVFYLVSAVFAFIVAVTNNFIFNKVWTFKESSNGRTHERYIIFFMVAIVAFFVNLSILYYVTEHLNVHYMISQLIAIAFSLWINFLGSKLFAFKK